MSLLGPPEPIGPWVPEPATVLPTEDAAAFDVLLRLLATLARRGRPTMDEQRDARMAWQRLGSRLLEGRVEAAEIRHALGLPMTATRGEVLAAIRQRST